MTRQINSKVIKLAAIPPLPGDKDVLVLNYDGTAMAVYCAPIIRALAHGLGVPLEILMAEDEKYKTKKPDGTWTGHIGMLQRGEADLSSPGTIISHERRKVVNFTYPLYVDDISFMTNKPEPYPRRFAILEVFSYEVWISIIISLISVSFLLYHLSKKERAYSTILMASIAYLLEKSYSFNLRNRYTAFVLLSWFLGITVIINSYKAVMLSIITFPRYEGIRDISDLAKAAEQRSVRCFVSDGISTNILFPSTDERYKSIGRCVNRYQQNFRYFPYLNYSYKKAFITNRNELNQFSRHSFVSEDSFSLVYRGVAYSKNFCCPKKLESVVHRITAGGLYVKFRKDFDFWTQLKLKFPDTAVSSERPISLSDLTGAFYVLAIGHVSSLFILVWEIACKKFRDI